MLDCYVLLDLETTGATPLKDRITEIALIRFEHGQEVARWQTLVNPHTSIPPFIQKLTGIDDAMVATAPSFVDVAETLLAYLEGAVLAAHNVRFDHAFLKNEFKRIGIHLKQKVICTVKLSRKLYPQFYTHGLDAIITRHGIVCAERHRAMGDVEVMRDFLRIASLELGDAQLRNTAQALLNGSGLTHHLDADVLDDIPEAAGVYILYGENQCPLYIGKSINLRTRVMSHFARDHASSKEMRLTQETRHIEWQQTAGELGALLLEAKLVKKLQPLHNRQLRQERQLCAWKIASNARYQPLVSLVRQDEFDVTQLDSLFGNFKTRRQAVEVLRKIAEQHGLCLKLLGLEPAQGACFAHQLKKCKGACVGKEDVNLHFLRLQQALAAHRMQAWPYQGRIAIREHDAMFERTDIHVFDQWCYLATVQSEAELAELLQSPTPAIAFDLDTYKLLVKTLQKKNVQILQLPQL